MAARDFSMIPRASTRPHTIVKTSLLDKSHLSSSPEEADHDQPGRDESRGHKLVPWPSLPQPPRPQHRSNHHVHLSRGDHITHIGEGHGGEHQAVGQVLESSSDQNPPALPREIHQESLAPGEENPRSQEDEARQVEVHNEGQRMHDADPQLVHGGIGCNGRAGAERPRDVGAPQEIETTSGGLVQQQETEDNAPDPQQPQAGRPLADHEGCRDHHQEGAGSPGEGIDEGEVPPVIGLGKERIVARVNYTGGQDITPALSGQRRPGTEEENRKEDETARSQHAPKKQELVLALLGEQVPGGVEEGRANDQAQGQRTHAPTRARISTAAIPAAMPSRAFFVRTATRIVRPSAMTRKPIMPAGEAPFVNPKYTKLAMTAYETN